MKRSSKIGLLFSGFSLICAMTLGSGMSKASQSSESVMLTASGSHVAIPMQMCKGLFAMPPIVTNWEEKRQGFDEMEQLYHQELDESQDMGHKHPLKPLSRLAMSLQ